MKILAFAASNSRKSINKTLIRYTSTLLPNSDVEIIDINDYEMPIYNSDLELVAQLEKTLSPLQQA